MPSAWCTCPVCGDEIEMEVKSMAGGYDGEFLIEIELDTQYCDCKLTDEVWICRIDHVRGNVRGHPTCTVRRFANESSQYRPS
jgi:hypothetical protein